jgi:hypothetical protein
MELSLEFKAPGEGERRWPHLGSMLDTLTEECESFSDMEDEGLE